MPAFARSKTKVAALAAAALIIAAAATWYLASPAWTLRQMKAAADANDADALGSYIDYPALRDDLKAEIKAQMAAQDQMGFTPLSYAIGSALIDRAVDGLVTPSGLRAALVAGDDLSRFPVKANAVSALHLPDDPEIERRGFSEFLVASKQQPNRGLVFKRHGLSWKLSGVELPPSR